MKRIAGICLLLLLIGAPSSAETITFSFVNPAFSGTSPGGGTPWLTATFTDVTGGVQLTMTVGTLLPSEFVEVWGFNIDPDLTLTKPTNTGGQNASVDVSPPPIKFDGDGYYDIAFSFPTAQSGDRFVSGDTSVWFFSGLTAADFLFLSAPGGGQGVYYTAAHVQGIADAPGGGWIAGTVVPEPLSALLVGAGLTLSSLVRWRRRRP
jgi:hypothetical protein